MNFLNKPYRLFILMFILLSFVIGVVILRGDRTYPEVSAISPSGENLAANARQIVLTFNRNMDRQSVEAGFAIEPKISGKFSWIGRKMAYSFDHTPEADQMIVVSVKGARDESGNELEKPYKKTYQTAKKNLYYINQNQALARFELGGQKEEVLSPEDLKVTDYNIHPDEKIIFLMSESESNPSDKNDLYRMELESGELSKIIDGKEEFIFSTALAPNGQFLLVRKGKVNPYDSGSLIDPGSLWIYDIASEKWSEFWNKELYGSEFYFSPDSHYLVGRLITGDIILVPVYEEAGEVVYLENYKGSYTLSPDGKKLAFVDFEDLFTPHTLLLRDQSNQSKRLIGGIGQIEMPAFSPDGERIYFLMSELEEGTLAIKPFYLHFYDLASDNLSLITGNKDFFEGFFSIASDGKVIAFERYPASQESSFFEQQLSNQAPESEIWLYDGTLKNIGLKGSKPYLN